MRNIFSEAYANGQSARSSVPFTFLLAALGIAAATFTGCQAPEGQRQTPPSIGQGEERDDRIPRPAQERTPVPAEVEPEPPLQSSEPQQPEDAAAKEDSDMPQATRSATDTVEGKAPEGSTERGDASEAVDAERGKDDAMPGTGIDDFASDGEDGEEGEKDAPADEQEADGQDANGEHTDHDGDTAEGPKDQAASVAQEEDSDVSEAATDHEDVPTGNATTTGQQRTDGNAGDTANTLDPANGDEHLADADAEPGAVYDGIPIRDVPLTPWPIPEEKEPEDDELEGLVVPSLPERERDLGDAEPLSIAEPDDGRGEALARRLAGRWVQHDGPYDAAFLEGGHVRGELHFTRTGRLEVSRHFDEAGTVRLRRVVDYQIDSNGQLALGQREKPGSDSLISRRVTLPAGGDERIAIEPPQNELPVALEVTVEDDRLILDGRTYRRMEEPE